MRLATIVLLLVAGSITGDEPCPTYGFEVGQKLQNKGMGVIHGEHDGKHTCLTGMYRNRRAISVYANEVSDDVFGVLKVVDEELAGDAEDRGFLLVFRDRKSKFEVYPHVRRLVKKYSLKRVDVALGGDTKKWGSFDFSNAVTVIDSDKRVIRLARTYAKGELTDEAIEKLRKDLDID